MRIVKRFLRSIVDSGIMLFSLGFLVEGIIEGFDIFTIAMLALLFLYSLGVIWRIGVIGEFMNEAVREDKDRILFNMGRYEDRDRFYKINILGAIFLLLEACILVIVIVL